MRVKNKTRALFSPHAGGSPLALAKGVGGCNDNIEIRVLKRKFPPIDLRCAPATSPHKWGEEKLNIKTDVHV